MLRQDLGLKIFSLLIAIVLWFYVIDPYASPSDKRVFKLNYSGLDTDKFILKKPPQTVTVNVQGPADALRAMHQLADEQFNADVDLSNATPGLNRYAISRLDAGPVKSQGLVFSPPMVNVDIEVKTSVDKNVTVEPAHIPSGLAVTDETMTPDTVSLRGAKADVDRVAKVVGRVDLAGYPSMRDFPAKVELEDKDGKPVSQVDANPAYVSVHPVLGVAVDRANLPVSLTWGSSLKHGYSIRDVSCDPSMITVAGKSNALSKVSVVKTEPINLAEVSADREIRVRLLSPGRGLTLPIRYVNVRIRVSRPPVAPAPAPITMPPTFTSPPQPTITAH